MLDFAIRRCPDFRPRPSHFCDR